MLVLDIGTSAPKRGPDPSAIILFHHSAREICRIPEDEHEQEHDFSGSAFRFSQPLAPTLPSERPCFDRIFALDPRFPPENRPRPSLTDQ